MKRAVDLVFVAIVVIASSLVAGCASPWGRADGSTRTTAMAHADRLGDDDAQDDTHLRAPQPWLQDTASLTPAERAAALDRYYADYWEATLALQPLRASSHGDARHHHRLPDFYSATFRTTVAQFDRAWLDGLRAIGSDGLDADARLSFRLLEAELSESIERERFPGWMLPLDQLSNPAVMFAEIGAGEGAHPFETLAHYDAWLARASRIPRLFASLQQAMRAGMREGVVPPKVLMHAVLPQIDALIAARAEATPFWRPIDAMPAESADGWPAHERERLTHAYRALIEGTLMPAYRELRRFVADEYLPACRDTVGLSALPDGAAWYAFRVRRATSLDLDPDDVHALGLREVARIRGEMQALKRSVGFKGSLDAFFDHLRDDARFAFKSERQMLGAFRALRAKVDRRVHRLFALQPQARFEIRRVDDVRAASDAAGSYRQPAADGQRPGIFYVNTHALPSRRTWDVVSLYLHEAVPGHHYQIALQQERKALPAFRRFGGETAFEEGWALYAESLGGELGLYTDPYQVFGRLQAELWRAIRLVVDTGLHAKGWSRDEVIDYMKRHSAVSDAEAQSEVDRYIANPGQALAYKIGELTLQRLRTQAERALGSAFDARAFHAEVLKDGALPLPLLEAKITRFVAQRRVDVAMMRAGAAAGRARAR